MNYRDIVEQARIALCKHGIEVTCEYGKPVNRPALDKVGNQLGISIPPDLARLYTELGDGFLFYWEKVDARRYGLFALIDLDRLAEHQQSRLGFLKEFIQEETDATNRRTATDMLNWLDFHEEGNGDTFALDLSKTPSPVVFDQHDWNDGGDGTNGFLLGETMESFIVQWGSLCFQRPRSLWWPSVRKGNSVDWTSNDFGLYLSTNPEATQASEDTLLTPELSAAMLANQVMEQKRKTRIEEYCRANGIVIPGGFARLPLSRYVLVRTDKTPPKLVAKTWCEQEDLVCYFQRFIVPEVGLDRAMALSILDFEVGRRMHFKGTSQLMSGEAFMRQEEDAEQTNSPYREPAAHVR